MENQPEQGFILFFVLFFYLYIMQFFKIHSQLEFQRSELCANYSG